MDMGKQIAKFRVRVTYSDGRVEEYAGLKDAGDALGVSPRAIRKYEFGRGIKDRRILDAIGVVDIRAIRRRKYEPVGFNASNVPVRITHTDGRVMEFRQSKDAADYIGCAAGCITRWRNDGMLHDGWLIETIENPKPVKIRYGNMPVPDAYIDEMYRMANHYLITMWGKYVSTDQDAADAVQEAVARTAADYSNGKYNPAKCAKWQTWAYCILKHYIYEYLRSIQADKSNFDDGPPEGRDDWLERSATARRPDNEDELLEEIPAELREVARLLLAGKNQYEICCILGHCEATVRRMERRIADWLAGAYSDSASE